MSTLTGRDYYELGNKYLVDHRTTEALSVFERAAALEPKQSAIPANIGVVLGEMGRIEEARAAYDKALSLEKNGYAPYELRKALLQPVIFDSVAQIGDERRRLNNTFRKFSNSKMRLSDPQNEVGNPAFFLAYQGLNNRETQALIARQLAKACPSLRQKFDMSRPSSRKKIRVGFFSAHFYEHTVGRVNMGLIKNLPREDFEVILIRPYGVKDGVTTMIQNAADSTLVVASTLNEARQSIADAELDVLLFADIGMEPLSYYLGFARLAPVQAALWGHPDTAGIENVDYYVSTKSFEPDNAQDAYSERLIKLPRHYICMDMPAEPVKKLPKSSFQCAKNENVYLCPQSLFKLHPDTDVLFDKVLRKDKQGVICLPAGTEENWMTRLRRRFAKTCPTTMERIRFIPRIAPESFRHALHSADVLLDPMHFTGGYTSYLGLSTGSPIVTMYGDFLPGRMTSGLYHQMGDTSLIAKDADDYASIAVNLANDPSLRKERSKMIEQTRGEIFNDMKAVGHFGEFLTASHDAAKRRELVRYE